MKIPPKEEVMDLKVRKKKNITINNFGGLNTLKFPNQERSKLKEVLS